MTMSTSAKHTHLKRCQAGKQYPNKLARKLDRQGSVYGRVSIVTQTFNDIQARKHKHAVNR